MARRIVRSSTCDRCYQERTATTTVQFCFGDNTYVLDLCNEHAGLWEQDMLAWVRLARDATEAHTQVRAKPSWTPGARYAPKVVIPERPPVVRVLEPDIAPYDGPEPTYDPRPEPVPSWTISTHAKERMEQRGVGLSEVLLTADSPMTRRPGREPELTVLERDDIKVVVHERRRIVVTVSRKGTEDDGTQDRD